MKHGETNGNIYLWPFTDAVHSVIYACNCTELFDSNHDLNRSKNHFLNLYEILYLNVAFM